MRNGWNANSLKGSLFERVIVGFDVRKNTSLNNLSMTSWNESIRYESLYENCEAKLSGMNLFSTDPIYLSSISFPKNSAIIAFDLPSPYVNFLSSGSVSIPDSLSLQDLSERWELVGFDIVDAITQTSALHGFERSASESDQVNKKLNFSLNKHGLVPDIDVAVKGAIFFELLIAEHAPFSPCGVWLKNSE
ncbi:MAG: hypothetical protein V4754_03875 [Pseudomonadota bacterium]